MVSTWDNANAGASSPRKAQYFEIMASRAIYRDEWRAARRQARRLGHLGQSARGCLNGFKRELYDLTLDPRQAHDLAQREPQRLHAMQEPFLVEATQVLPLKNLLTRNGVFELLQLER
jgi:arylsulfatase